MNKKALIHANKYLRDPSTRNTLIISHADSTSRIEGISVKGLSKKWTIVKIATSKNPRTQKSKTLQIFSKKG